MSQVTEIISKMPGVPQRLGSLRNSSGLYDAVFSMIAEVFGCHKAAVLMKEPDLEVIVAVAKHGPYDELTVGDRVNLGEGVKAQALLERRTQMVSTTIDNGEGTSDACEAAIPIINAAGEAIGVISMKGPGNCFHPELAPLLGIFGDIVSLGITNLKSRGDVDERARRLAVISKTMQMVASDIDSQTLLHRGLELTRNALHPDGCSIQLYSLDRSHLLVAAALGIREDLRGIRIPKDSGVLGVALETRRPSLAPNMADANAPTRSPLSSDYLSELAVPLMFKNQVLGVLYLGHRQAGVFDETDLLTASILADCLAEGIGVSRMLSAKDDSAAFRNAELSLISQVIRETTRYSNFHEIFSEVFPQAAAFLQLKRAAVLLPDAVSGHFKVAYVFGYDETFLGQHIPHEKSLTGEAYRTAEAVYAREGREVAESAISVTEMPVKAALPMKFANEVTAVLFVESDVSLDPTHISTLKTVAAHLSPFLAVERLNRA